ncbi:xanthine and Co dehydrogenase maturation factor [Polycladomyces abyssicola]|uniref:Xanthine and Co dehydrogenase maturation factor n=1 Tax=Polycladomyces abyssicola TaxID=1125966 RepID=A0A8D5UFY5_9BACL|nr:XdhC family protein [Polycladomyces abyssicola]BCU81741.1 xanthine and Co dehydrogenase maturation factor [Polycladomyces abyssicola]
MHTIPDEIRLLEERREPYAVVTVVRRVRPSSANVGDKAVVTSDGRMFGFVGGQCTRGLVTDQAQQCLKTGQSQLLLITANPPAEVEEGVTVLPMTCQSEGEVELFIEPKLPDPLLVVIGDSPVALALEELAPKFGWFSRRLALEQMEENGDDPAERLKRNLSQVYEPKMYAVVATMGQYDDVGLLALQKFPLAYAGVVISPKRWRSLREALLSAGASAEFCDFVVAPAGYDIGAVGPQEIALSIFAQMIERRRRQVEVRYHPPSNMSISETSAEKAAHVSTSQRLGTGVDPVCGMRVDLDSTPYRTVHEGKTYGFCCPHCLRKFQQEPETYAIAR